MSYIKEFNQIFENILAPEVDSKTWSTLTLIRAAPELLQCTNVLELTTFYSNLRKLLTTQIQNNSKNILCHVVPLVFKALQVNSNRKILLEELNLIPVVANLLPFYPNDRPIILKVLQELTFGFQIQRHEFYLENFIAVLVDMVNNNEECLDLALSVLLNICMHNPICKSMLLRSVSSKEFLSRIKDRGMYASQLYLCLDPENGEINSNVFINFVDEETKKALGSWDVTHFKQIISFVKNVQSFSTLEETIKKTVDNTKQRLSMEDSHNENCGRSMGQLFELLNFFVKATPELENTTAQLLVELALGFCRNVDAVLNVIKLLKTLVEKKMVTNSTAFASSLQQLVHDAKVSKDFEFKNAFLQFIQILTETFKAHVIEEADSSFFIKEISIQNEKGYTDYDNIEFVVNIIYLCYILSKLDASASTVKYYPKFLKLLKSPNISYIFAKALKGANPETVKTVLCLSQSEEFPTCQVAQCLSHNNISMQIQNDNYKVLQYIIPDTYNSAEKKLDLLIQRISQSKLNDVLSIEVMEVYQSKLSILRRSVETLTNYRINAEKEITELRHTLAIFNAQASIAESVEMRNATKLLNSEQTNKILSVEIKNLKQGLETINKKVDKKSESVQQITKKLKLREAEVLEYKERYERSEQKLNEETEKLTKKIEEMRTSLKNYELSIKKKQDEVEKLKSLNEVMNKSMVEVQKEKEYFSNLVKQQQERINESEAKIQEYENNTNRVLKLAQAIQQATS